jgi:hypothetical protein
MVTDHQVTCPFHSNPLLLIVNENERTELGFYKGEVAKLREELQVGEEDDRGSENNSYASEDDDVMDDIPIEELKKKNKGFRQSVSAEAFGDFNKKASFVPPKHPKTPELRVKLEAKLG